jgi:phosphate transport system substrate-binding protein
VTNKALTVDCLTTAQLKKLWNKGSKVKSLSELEALPARHAALALRPGTDSGTFDFFTTRSTARKGVTREDYEASEDDNQLVTGVAGDEGGLGYFGFSYYEEARQAQPRRASTPAPACVRPSAETVQDGPTRPLAAPAVHVPRSKRSPARGQGFMDFVDRQPGDIAKAPTIVPLLRAAGANRAKRGAKRGR